MTLLPFRTSHEMSTTFTYTRNNGTCWLSRLSKARAAWFACMPLATSLRYRFTVQDQSHLVMGHTVSWRRACSVPALSLAEYT